MADVIEATVLISIIFLMGVALGAIAAVLVMKAKTGSGHR